MAAKEGSSKFLLHTRLKSSLRHFEFLGSPKIQTSRRKKVSLLFPRMFKKAFALFSHYPVNMVSTYSQHVNEIALALGPWQPMPLSEPQSKFADSNYSRERYSDDGKSQPTMFVTQCLSPTWRQPPQVSLQTS